MLAKVNNADRQDWYIYICYGLYKYWILSENGKINFNTACIIKFIKKDLFHRTIYNKDKYFVLLCDKVISQL